MGALAVFLLFTYRRPRPSRDALMKQLTGFTNDRSNFPQKLLIQHLRTLLGALSEAAQFHPSSSLLFHNQRNSMFPRRPLAPAASQGEQATPAQLTDAATRFTLISLTSYLLYTYPPPLFYGGNLSKGV